MKNSMLSSNSLFGRLKDDQKVDISEDQSVDHDVPGDHQSASPVNHDILDALYVDTSDDQSVVHDVPVSPRPTSPLSQDIRAALEDMMVNAMSVVSNRDSEQVQFAQLEIQVGMLRVLNAIDWKLWEIHNKFVK